MANVFEVLQDLLRTRTDRFNAALGNLKEVFENARLVPTGPGRAEVFTGMQAGKPQTVPIGEFLKMREEAMQFATTVSAKRKTTDIFSGEKIPIGGGKSGGFNASAILGKGFAGGGHPVQQVIQSVMNMAGALTRINLPGMKELNKVFKGIEKIIKNPIEGSIDMIVDMINTWLELTGVLEPINMLAEIFTSTLQAGLAPALGQVFDALMQPAIIDAITSIAQSFAEFLLPSMDIFANLVNRFVASGALDLLVDLFATLTKIFVMLSPILDQILLNFADFADALLSVVIQIFQAIPWETVIPMIVQFTETMLNFINGVHYFFYTLWLGIQDFIRGLTNTWNAFATSLNNLDVLNIFPDMPVIALASGGVVTRPTIALLGESGPEAVVPLGSGASEYGGGTTINVNGFVGYEMLNEISRELKYREDQKYFGTY